MRKIEKQKSTEQYWKDEKGILCLYNRTTKSERLMEAQSYKLAKEALKLNQELSAFKKYVKEVCQEVYDTYMAEREVTQTKGNFTWYNYDRSIRVEVSINERIEFDDLGITACKAKLHDFLQENVESKDAFIKDMVMDAFETSRGKLDAKKVMSLLRYRSKIKNQLFQDALNLLEESIRRPESKTYFRVSTRNDDGKYDVIDLNFSSI